MHKHIKLFLFLLPFVCFVQLRAQQKTLTIEDAVLKAGTTLGPADLQNLNWIGNSGTFSFIDQNTLMRGQAASAKTEPLLTLGQLNKALTAAKFDTLSKFPSVRWLDAGRMLFGSGNDYFTYSLKSGKTEKVNSLPEGAENTDMQDNRLTIAYTKENNLYISFKDKEDVAVTNEQNKGIVNGQAAHRNEFGIMKGTFWSPKGNYLAYYRMDQSMVTDYPIVDITPKPAVEKPIKYPMAGMKSHEVTVGVYDLSSGKTTFLKTTGDPEQYLTNISWSPDEKNIYIAVLNRGQNHLWLNKYDASTGDFIKTLFEETDDKYVEPLDPLIFVKNKPDQFIWQSQRDGYKHMYLYDTEGKLLRQLTKGNWVVTQYIGFDEAGKNVFYLSTAESPLEQHIYAASLDGKGSKKLSSVAGTHTALLSPDGKYIVDRFSSTSIPRRITVMDQQGKYLQTLLDAPNPLKDYKLGETRMVELKAEDGTKLYGRIILPTDFNPAKKYPVVVYVYGGPHVQLVTNTWLGGSNLWMQYMAENGYIMFTLDSRGSYNRGLAFEQVTFRNLGTVELQDQMKGVEYLRSLPYVDTARMGVHGWSFGGFMTTSLMLREPGTFKVGVAGGPVIDWKFYEVMYTERYMDTPQENKEGYEKANLLNYVKNLKGRLLMIHGTVDDVVVWQHSLSFLKKAVDEGVQLDYFVYPGHPHNVRGKDRVHLMKKITQYFDDFLK